MMKFGAIMFTDIQNSSEMWGNAEDDMLKKLQIHNKRIINLVNKTDGVIIKNIGDSFMCYFKNCLDSVKCAIKIILAMKKNPIIVKQFKTSTTMKIRIGIAVGMSYKISSFIQGKNTKDYVGPLVNAASRLESMVSPSNGFAITFLDMSSIDCEEIIPEFMEKDKRFKKTTKLHKNLRGVRQIIAHTYTLR